MNKEVECRTGNRYQQQGGRKIYGWIGMKSCGSCIAGSYEVDAKELDVLGDDEC
jgi:hypothetical protein